MPTTIQQFSWIYIAAGMVLFPLIIGFFLEAGKDLYNKLRGKKTNSEIKEEIERMCENKRNACPTSKDFSELSKDSDFMMGRQNTLRQKELPELTNKIDLLNLTVSNIDEKVDEIKTSITKLFDLWDSRK